MTDSPDVRRPRRVRVVASVAIAVAAVALVLAWTVTPLARLADPNVLVAHAQAVRDWPLAPLAVVLFHVVAGFVATPATVLIGATILLFGPWPGALYAYVGMLANAVTLYAVGRFAGRDLVNGWLARREGSPAAAVSQLLARRGLVAIALARLTPVPYLLMNVMAGASRIRFVDYVVGTALGILPVTVVMAGLVGGFAAGLTGGLDGWLDRVERYWWLAAIVVFAVVAVVGRVAMRRVRRVQPDRLRDRTPDRTPNRTPD